MARRAQIIFALCVLCAVPSLAAVCKGDTPCLACKDCSKCAYCTSGKGSCSVLREQTEEQARQRRAKQKPPPPKR